MKLEKIELPVDVLDGLTCVERREIVGKNIGRTVRVLDWHKSYLIGCLCIGDKHTEYKIATDEKLIPLAYHDICELGVFR